MNDQQPDVKLILGEAAEIASTQERVAFLDRACQNHPKVRAEVEHLLEALREAGSFMAKPAATQPYAPPLSEGPGAVIGTYKLLQQIGEGGMGTVFMAEQTEPVQRKVALKIIKPGMDSKQVVARFEAERQALAMMDHINIARVLDAGTTESGRPFFVMELVHGVPIHEYCDTNQLTPRERLELFIPVCQAIQHAHQKGIIHRDIKPSNVLVTMYDDKPVPKVIDFGVAKAIEQKLTTKTLFTQYGAMVGTFEYVSPEQAEMNAFGVDTRSDVYSLGVLLYELLTGTTPLERSRLREAAFGEIVRLIKEEEPPRPSVRLSTSETLAKVAAARRMEPAKLSSLVRGELDWIVMKCLEKDRTRRYETANGLAKDVQRYLGDEPVEACPPTLGYRLRKTYRKHRAGILTGLALATMLLVTSVVSIVFGARSVRAERDAVAQRRFAEDRSEEASAQKRLAEANFAKAKATQRTLEAERDQLKNRVYAQLMWKANVALDNGNFGAARALLEETEQRGWAWHYLNRRCNGGYRYSLDGHERRFNLASFSPDGKWVLTNGYKNKTVVLWDARTGKAHKELTARTGPVSSARFNSDGKRIFTVSLDGTVRVWSTETGKEIPEERFETREELVYYASLSPNDKWMVTSGLGPKRKQEAKVWNLETRKAQISLTFPKNWGLGEGEWDFSDDGMLLLTASQNEDGSNASGPPSNFQLWDLATGKELLSLKEHLGIIRWASLSPDGKRVAATCSENTLRKDEDVKLKILDLRTKKIQSVEADENLLFVLEFSPDSTKFVTIAQNPGTEDYTVLVWNAETGERISKLGSHPGDVLCSWSAAFSPDGKRITTASSRDRTAKVWDVATGELIRVLAGHSGGVNWVSFSPDGESIVTASRDDKTAKVWDVTPKPHSFDKLTTELSEGVYHLSYSADGKRMIVNRSKPDGGLVASVLSPDTGKIVAELHYEAASPLVPATISSDGTRIVTANRHKDSGFIAKLWELQDDNTFQMIKSWKIPTTYMQELIFSPDGKWIAARRGDSTPAVWNVKADDLLPKPVDGHSGEVLSVVFSPDGTKLVTSSTDGTAKMWDFKNGRVIRTLEGHTDAVRRSSFSHDGRRIVTVGGDGTAIVWDADTGKRQLTLKGHNGRLTRASFSPDDSRILTCGWWDDDTVKLWDAIGGYEILSYQPPNKHPRDALFSPDGRWVIVIARPEVFILDGSPSENEGSASNHE